MSGDISRILRHKEAYGFCNLICTADSAKGNRLLKLSGVGCRQQVGFDEPGTDGVYGYSSRGNLFGQSLGGSDEPALRCRIVDLTSIARNSRVRHHVYDSTEAPSYHWQHQGLSEIEEAIQSGVK